MSENPARVPIPDPEPPLDLDAIDAAAVTADVDGDWADALATIRRLVAELRVAAGRVSELTRERDEAVARLDASGMGPGSPAETAILYYMNQYGALCDEVHRLAKRAENFSSDLAKEIRAALVGPVEPQEPRPEDEIRALGRIDTPAKAEALARLITGGPVEPQEAP